MAGNKLIDLELDGLSGDRTDFVADIRVEDDGGNARSEEDRRKYWSSIVYRKTFTGARRNSIYTDSCSPLND